MTSETNLVSLNGELFKNEKKIIFNTVLKKKKNKSIELSLPFFVKHILHFQ